MRRTSILISERDDTNTEIIIRYGYADNASAAIRVALARFAAIAQLSPMVTPTTP